MIPRRFTRVLIGAALLGIAALTITALKLAMPGSGAAESRNASTTAPTPNASNATRLNGSEALEQAEDALSAPSGKPGAHRASARARGMRSGSCDEHTERALEAGVTGAATGGSFSKPHASGCMESRPAGDVRAEPDAGGGSVGVTRTLSVIPLDAATW